jgi:hypothetical protein
MIKHIVMWRLKDEALGSSKERNARKLKELLEGLKEKIPEIIQLEVGINISLSEGAYDVALVSEFEDEKALDRYQHHPEHKKATEFVSKVRQDRVVLDYNS